MLISPQYTFHTGMDVYGHDSGKLSSRDDAEQRCTEWDYCVAFNTEGYTKFGVPAASALNASHYTGCQGLYSKDSELYVAHCCPRFGGVCHHLPATLAAAY